MKTIEKKKSRRIKPKRVGSFCLIGVGLFAALLGLALFVVTTILVVSQGYGWSPLYAPSIAFMASSRKTLIAVAGK